MTITPVVDGVLAGNEILVSSARILVNKLAVLTSVLEPLRV
jgi:hypothetical protein